MQQQFTSTEIKLRVVRTQPVIDQGRRGIVISDPMGISDEMVFVPGPLTLLLPLMDGTRDLATLKTGFELRTGTTISAMTIEQVVSKLDEALFLENERFNRAYAEALNEYRSASSRPPVLTGMCCPLEPDELHKFLDSYLSEAGNAENKYPDDVKGMISPHIDYARGGEIYAKVWSRANEALRNADLIVILGTDHNDIEANITLTYQSYETPWGIIPTPKKLVDEFASELGEGIFKCEMHHRKEHSIEAALIWAHHLLRDRECEVLPILCGSFQPMIDTGGSPASETAIQTTIGILKRLAHRRRTFIVAAADLAHQGPVFGDPQPLDLLGRHRMVKHDEELINIMCRGNAEDFFSVIHEEGDSRHVCGVSPIYIALSALGTEGRFIGYEQCPASEDATSMVSICGILY
jgi:AmmeMemoRadiSam system protein B